VADVLRGGDPSPSVCTGREQHVFVAIEIVIQIAIGIGIEIGIEIEPRFPQVLARLTRTRAVYRQLAVHRSARAITTVSPIPIPNPIPIAIAIPIMSTRNTRHSGC
jgi:hypothetical protein